MAAKSDREIVEEVVGEMIAGGNIKAFVYGPRIAQTLVYLRKGDRWAWTGMQALAAVFRDALRRHTADRERQVAMAFEAVRELQRRVRETAPRFRSLKMAEEVLHLHLSTMTLDAMAAIEAKYGAAK